MAFAEQINKYSGGIVNEKGIENDDSTQLITQMPNTGGNGFDI